MTSTHLETLLNMLQTEVMVQQQVVRDRSTVFLMLSRMLTDKLDIIKQMETLFTLTLIQAADNETDPRNLLLIFNTKHSILQCLEVKHHREEIFESLSVYFPVDFTPPSGVVASVTKEQLQQSLRTAITHHTLTQWTLELILEKLDSDLDSAKIDSLETLIELCQQGSERRSLVLEHWSKQMPGVWSALKTELMGLRMQSNKTVTQLSAQAVTAVSQLLSSRSGVVTTDNDECWSSWWSLIITDCRQGLTQPGTRLIQTSVQVLVSVVNSGDRAASAVLDSVTPQLCQLLEQDTAADSVKREVLTLSSQLLSSAAGQHVQLSESVTGHVDKIFTMFISSIPHHSEAGLGVARFAGLLTECQRRELADTIIAELRNNKPGLGPAVAELVQCDQHLVESVILPEIVSLGSEVSLECVEHVWRSGMFYETLPPLVIMISSTTVTTETRVNIVKAMSEYKLNDEDIDKVRKVAPEIVKDLLNTAHHDWPVEHAEMMCSLLSQLSQLLTPDTFNIATDQLDDDGYTASIMTHVSPDIVRTWSPHLLSTLMRRNTDHCWRLVSSIVNKCPHLAPDPDHCPHHGVGWVCAGLVKRGDGTGSKWLEVLLTQLESEEASVKMVTMLMEQHWWSHATVGLLYKQRLWSQLLPALTRVNTPRHVSALVLSLPHVPAPLLSSSLSSVLPRVVSALSSHDTCLPALTCLDNMMRSHSPDLISSYLTEIVHHCLDTCQHSGDVRTRILSLSVLSTCSSLQDSTTVQLSSRVTRDLRTVLADRKRLVRMEAARTRNKWFLVTQPS